MLAQADHQAGHAWNLIGDAADHAVVVVAERTVYAAFHGKADLFGEVLGIAIVGDDLPVPARDRPEFRAALAERDGRRALTRAVGHAADLFERAGPLIMVTVEAAGVDP